MTDKELHSKQDSTKIADTERQEAVNMNAENMNTGKTSTDKKPSKGIYILPNLFTTAGLFFGCYAIMAAINANFESAAIALFIAMVMDGLDGRVARLTNTMSDFGKEYDSLSDVISFGLAPAICIYFYALVDAGKLGMVVAFMYVASTALRLARFNSNSADIDKKYFQGLPCPSAAAVIASFIWLGDDNQHVFPAFVETYGAIILAVATALAMVSNLAYYSFKDINLKSKMSFVGLFMVVLIFVFIALDPPIVLFSLFFIYLLSGPLLTITAVKKSVDKMPSVSDAFDLTDDDEQN